ncbi:carboxypeptidase-like regulatory domain-containing protein [Bremerella sp. JC817]|uniref:carboxypeptidase-like regulatory domain-containing protein n=1 Tax=Bremerella sp. JC817 TaxID=3231756 RepID=UPI0034599BFE
MFRCSRLGSMLCLAMLVGCGPPPSIPGGTSGKLHADGVPLKEIRVNVFDSAGNATAFAVTDGEGAFELRDEASLTGVDLAPGSYRITLESAGEFQMVWPHAYRSPTKTPLQVEWSPEQEQLDLNVPTPRAAY